MTATATPPSSNGATTDAPAPNSAEPVEVRLQAIETEVRRQGRSVRAAQRSWSIFAVFALVISGATLIAVAAKLDAKSSTPAPAAAAPAAVAPAPATPVTPGKVGVSMKEFSINLAATQAPAGRVTFNVRNSGAVPHEFVVLRTDKPAGSLLKGAEADEAGWEGGSGGIPPGAPRAPAAE